MTMKIGVISPQDWGLPVSLNLPDTPLDDLGISLAQIAARAKAATMEWLPQQFNHEAGAFFGYYRVPDGYREPPQTVNLIAPWQLLAAYDRTQDGGLLEMARRAAEWFYTHHVVDHPMSVVAGGVRDGVATSELWTKFAAEEIITCLGLWTRTGEDVWRERALQSGRYLIQARRHDFAPRYSLAAGRWLDLGWDSWGRAVEALLLLWQSTDDARWRDEAIRWGEHALAIQGETGSFYLIDGEYYNTDLAADELRGLTLLYEVTGRHDFLSAACRFADWHLAVQLENGAWSMTHDREGNVVVPIVGPGDVPNIAMALLRLVHVCGDDRYLAAALKAFRYSLSIQVTPESAHPYRDDPAARWGFWSWDPYYDYTQSLDQATHHVRGMWFLIDFWQQR
jgi:rhamnogalacturonyl hydrolase YesR